MRDQLYVALDALGGLPPQVLNAVAEQVVAGLVMVVERCRDIIRYSPLLIKIAVWLKDFWPTQFSNGMGSHFFPHAEDDFTPRSEQAVFRHGSETGDRQP
jgi:hypothetical protein